MCFSSFFFAKIREDSTWGRGKGNNTTLALKQAAKRNPATRWGNIPESYGARIIWIFPKGHMDLFVTPAQPVCRSLNYANSWVTTCHPLADHCGKHMPALSLHLMHRRRILAAEVTHFNHGLRRDGGRKCERCERGRKCFPSAAKQR